MKNILNYCHIFGRFNVIQRLNKDKKVYFNSKILINHNINTSGDKEIGDIYNILITGVGGQGVVLLGKILREYGMRSQLIKNVVGTETRGVSQREGSVSATARYLIDDRLYKLEENYDVDDLISPTIPLNDSHLVLGLEPLETVRNIKFISEKSLVIVNTNKNFPRNVMIGSKNSKKYPSNAYILEKLDELARRVISMDFSELSREKFNNPIYANIILLGVGVKEFKEIFEKKLMIKLLEETFKESDNNIKAFELGYKLIS